jgi:hypothetical protein
MRNERQGDRRNSKDKTALAHRLGRQSMALRQQGDTEGALALLVEQEVLWRELDDRKELAECFVNQALVLAQRGEREGARPLLEEARGLTERRGPNALAGAVANFLRCISLRTERGV